MAMHRIDTHHHPYPPVYIEKTGDVLKHTTHAFYERLKNWQPSQAIEAMDKDGIAVSVLSVSTPSVVARRRRRVAGVRARGQRGRGQDAAGLPGPLRPFRRAGAARRRGQPARDRIRLRHAQGRRHRADDQLHRQVSGRRGVRAGVRRAQPAQGRGVFPSDRGELCVQRHPQHSAADDRISVRHHARDRQPAVRRHVPPLPQHQMDLLPRRRRARR